MVVIATCSVFSAVVKPSALAGYGNVIAMAPGASGRYINNEDKGHLMQYPQVLCLVFA